VLGRGGEKGKLALPIQPDFQEKGIGRRKNTTGGEKGRSWRETMVKGRKRERVCPFYQEKEALRQPDDQVSGKNHRAEGNKKGDAEKGRGKGREEHFPQEGAVHPNLGSPKKRGGEDREKEPTFVRARGKGNPISFLEEKGDQQTHQKSPRLEVMKRPLVTRRDRKGARNLPVKKGEKLGSHLTIIRGALFRQW